MFVIIASPDNDRRHAIKQEAASERLVRKWEACFIANGWTVHKVLERVSNELA